MAAVSDQHVKHPGNAPDRIPVILLTGFLGSGKTTFLNALMQHPNQPRTLILMNEFGEVPIDHDLVAFNRDDAVMETLTGCICCSIRSDLARTLVTAPARFARGGKTWFERVIIETTGLADPASLLKTLLDEPEVARRYHLKHVLTAVDSANGVATLARQLEAVRQVAIADVLLLTKTDLVDQTGMTQLLATLDQLNPSARRVVVEHGGVDAERFASLLEAIPTAATNPIGWLDAESCDTVQREGRLEAMRNRAAHGPYSPADIPAHDRREPDQPGGAFSLVHGHAGEVTATCFTLDTPVHGAALDAWLDSQLMFRGPDLLRMKGIIHIAEVDRPMVIHGVQHVFHPPLLLARWPSEDRRSRIVFITRGITAEELEQTLRVFNTGHALRRADRLDAQATPNDGQVDGRGNELEPRQ